MLRYILIGSLCAGLGAVSISKQDAWRTTVACCQENVAARLQQSSVTVLYPVGHGSGMLFQASDGSWWVWTAGHVARHGNTPIIILPTQQRVQGLVVRCVMPADIALIRILDPIYGCRSVIFHEGMRPTVGDPVYAVGTPGDDHHQTPYILHSTVTAGILSYTGRDYPPYGPLDQCSAATLGGSSGCMIADQRTGNVLGIVTRGPGETFTLFVPTWRIREFAQEAGVEFAMNPNLAVPENFNAVQ